MKPSQPRKQQPNLSSRNVEQIATDPFEKEASRLQAPRPFASPSLRRIASQTQFTQPDILQKALQHYLAENPNDPDALNMLAQMNVRIGRDVEAEPYFSRCLEQAPDFSSARFKYAKLLVRLKKFPEALAQFDRLLLSDPRNPLLRYLRANVLELAGANSEALAVYEHLAQENSGRVQSWITYANALRTGGFHEKSIAAYRKALEIDFAAGAAWWGLANLKTFRFNDEDIAAMEQQLKHSSLPPSDRWDIELTLGKAYEDRRAYAQSWLHYAKGNAGQRLASVSDPITATARIAANKALFTAEFFHNRKDSGSPAPDPIFVVGRMRSGSTLIEQILSSHSAVEGTAELPYIPSLANRLKDADEPAQGGGYPAVLGMFSPDALREMGEDYLAKTRLHRKTARPFFIDKNPPNYFHVGLIHLILPRARIIDARRNPAATCLSIFKQGFRDLNLRLDELGRVYRDYVELMAHFDAVLPGKIHRVIYEDMVRDPENETRKLLDYLGLPFEDSCLRFYETERAIFTPSSEQVRKPISGDAVDQWRNYEQWLGPLIRRLGSVLTAYPDVPADLR